MGLFNWLRPKKSEEILNDISVGAHSVYNKRRYPTYSEYMTRSSNERNFRPKDDILGKIFEFGEDYIVFEHYDSINAYGKKYTKKMITEPTDYYKFHMVNGYYPYEMVKSEIIAFPIKTKRILIEEGADISIDIIYEGVIRELIISEDITNNIMNFNDFSSRRGIVIKYIDINHKKKKTIYHEEMEI